MLLMRISVLATQASFMTRGHHRVVVAGSGAIEIARLERLLTFPTIWLFRIIAAVGVRGSHLPSTLVARLYLVYSPVLVRMRFTTMAIISGKLTASRQHGFATGTVLLVRLVDLVVAREAVRLVVLLSLCFAMGNSYSTGVIQRSANDATLDILCMG